MKEWIDEVRYIASTVPQPSTSAAQPAIRLISDQRWTGGDDRRVFGSIISTERPVIAALEASATIYDQTETGLGAFLGLQSTVSCQINPMRLRVLDRSISACNPDQLGLCHGLR